MGEETADTRKQKITLSGGIKRLKNLRDFLANIALLILITLVLVYVFKDSDKRTMIIEPFHGSLGKSKELSGEYLASYLRHQVSIITDVESSFPKKNIKELTQFQNQKFEIKDPLTGVNLKTLKSFVQQIVFGNQLVYKGFLAKDSSYYRISLEDSNGKSIQYSFKNQSDIYKIINRISEDIVEKEDPYQLGIFMLARNTDISKCQEIGQSILNNSNLKDDFKGYHLRGNYYLRTYLNEFKIDLLELAQNDYRKVLSAKGNFAVAHNNMGVTHFYMENIDSSIFYYKNSLKRDASYFGAHLNLGNSYWYRSGQDSSKRMSYLDSAIVSYNNAIRIKRSNIKPYIALGNVLWESGKKEKAIEQFNKAIQIDLDNPFPHHQLGLKYYKDNDILGAFRKFKEAKALYKKKGEEPVKTRPPLDSMIIILKDSIKLKNIVL